MSRFSEKRLASDLVRAIDGQMHFRRRRAMGVGLSTFCVGLIGNFVFNKIEVAVVLWVITLLAIADLILSFGALAMISLRRRVALVLIIALVGLAASWSLIYGQYRVQHAALLRGRLRAHGQPQGKSPVLQFGDGSSKLTWLGADGKPVLKTYANNITIERGKDGELQVSTTVRDRSGNLI